MMQKLRVQAWIWMGIGTGVTFKNSIEPSTRGRKVRWECDEHSSSDGSGITAWCVSALWDLSASEEVRLQVWCGSLVPEIQGCSQTSKVSSWLSCC